MVSSNDSDMPEVDIQIFHFILPKLVVIVFFKHLFNVLLSDDMYYLN